ncbi:MAG: UDP-N-acetylmuramoyl-L-alanine--D-glutamate ligase [Candidatus Syntrophonatronum acetioxidans]|uniref:UDP-N-acetylmuramoylalanine--D-glutamate ligase n=1 Tax=Candidatus Syntrophonatronum acetioxidans TaxID=1795816 RepID=A0A424YB25_9FIRM|nr:MAG: UDP-N-acetylmuramoyl-L-alanine--D-glutamate ligase [Candidatus Syntrophonatronum acetioxidans]
MELKGKEVVVLGMGLSGVSAAKLMAQEGAFVIINDCKGKEDLKTHLKELEPYKNLKTVMGGHPEDIVNKNTHLVVKSPGIPMNIKPVKKALELGIKIITEIEVAFSFINAPVIGITGTNGKTTTTTLIGEILKEDGRKVHLAGNIGVPLCDIAQKVSSDSFVVAELSSFQLEGIDNFKPYISVILNISEDHMDHHYNLENYLEAKKRIYKNQEEKDFLVINRDDSLLSQIPRNEVKAKVIYFSTRQNLESGIYIQKEHIVIKEKGTVKTVCPVKETALPGKHNLENMLAASAVARAAGVEPQVIASTLRTFRGVPHRLEFVCSFNGVTFINDSKGTNINSTIKALEAFPQKVILIAGGKDKGSSFEELASYIQEKVKHLILMGETRGKIADSLEKIGFENYVFSRNMKEALEKAYQSAREGDLVLLSPACASWDMYNNYEERGNEFKKLANNLGRKQNEEKQG